MKNGFTLVELLAVIVILSIIFTLVYPTVDNIINDSEDTTYQKQINTILEATYDWSLKNTKYLPARDNKIYITLSRLKSSGLVDNNIIDPKSSELFSNDLVISISNVGGNYKYNSSLSKQGGDYLYTVESDLMSSVNYRVNKPIITLNGFDYSTDGVYTHQINLGEEYIEPTYTAVNSSKVDISDKIVKIINYNDTAVTSFNTNKAGIYKINYTVVDSEGYSNQAILNIIVVDDELPVLIFPDNNTISESLTSFDLKDGVTCTDNSGKCDITTSGTITLGVSGTYVIEYRGQDPSGNTVTQKRIITIE